MSLAGELGRITGGMVKDANVNRNPFTTGQANPFSQNGNGNGMGQGMQFGQNPYDIEAPSAPNPNLANPMQMQPQNQPQTQKPGWFGSGLNSVIGAAAPVLNWMGGDPNKYHPSQSTAGTTIGYAEAAPALASLPLLRKIPGAARLSKFYIPGLDTSRISHGYNRLTDPENTPRYYMPDNMDKVMTGIDAVKAPLTSLGVGGAIGALAEGSDWAMNGAPDRATITGTNDPTQVADLKNKDSWMGTYAIRPDDNPWDWLGKSWGGIVGNPFSAASNALSTLNIRNRTSGNIYNEYGRLTGSKPGFMSWSAPGATDKYLREINQMRAARGQGEFNPQEIYDDDYWSQT